MAERIKSKDGTRETEQVLGQTPEEMEEAPGHAGRSDGEIARKVGTRDEGKAVDETSNGRTAPKAQDQDGSGDKEKV
ncbi:hypothetical protein SAMN05421759_11014 [Roseivivax lentus]|uniref:Uncharacterized protein n=1 Tax=Roseivivax lentus TaxID=633194 RepID=A0A1N7NSK8_9RHOB|nr:hypothetical protein [Roseivivax lentus]SIT01219.1 hypothetical protein SAMN05421759_11014 [Roseivivax lentus]